MAKLKENSGDAITGRLGDAVYVNLNGRTIIRRRPRVDPTKRTPAQLRNQERFRRIHQFGAQFKQLVIPQIWNDYSKTDNGYNLFIKSNTAAFGPDGELLDPAKIRLSVGDLPLVEQLQARMEANGSRMIQVSWAKASHQGGMMLQDELMVISSGDGKYSDIKPTGLTRGSLGGSFALPEQPTNVSHIYLFFASYDRRHYSESVCMEIR